MLVLLSSPIAFNFSQSLPVNTVFLKYVQNIILSVESFWFNPAPTYLSTGMKKALLQHVLNKISPPPPCVFPCLAFMSTLLQLILSFGQPYKAWRKYIVFLVCIVEKTHHPMSNRILDGGNCRLYSFSLNVCCAVDKEIHKLISWLRLSYVFLKAYC